MGMFFFWHKWRQKASQPWTPPKHYQDHNIITIIIGASLPHQHRCTSHPVWPITTPLIVLKFGSNFLPTLLLPLFFPSHSIFTNILTQISTLHDILREKLSPPFPIATDCFHSIPRFVFFLHANSIPSFPNQESHFHSCSICLLFYHLLFFTLPAIYLCYNNRVQVSLNRVSIFIHWLSVANYFYFLHTAHNTQFPQPTHPYIPSFSANFSFLFLFFIEQYHLVNLQKKLHSICC